MPTQSCPNCGRAHDVGVYVTGQKFPCPCGIRFEVRRTDVTPRPSALAAGPRAAEDEPIELLAVPPPAEAASAVPTLPPRNAVDRDRTFIGTPKRPAIAIPGFELQELLGRGGMGEVWRARQKSLGRTVAVKLLPVDLAADDEFVKRFDKEASALAALSHPNIVAIIDRGQAGPHYYFAMEFVEGRSLRELIHEARPSPQQALRVVAQILRAIECAHEKGIIHRDLKPENVLVDARGHAKVADFGLAGMREAEDAHLTATAVAMGTVNYMAPEQRRDARNVDGRADLFSVGVILYELLTGELPIGRFRLPSERTAALDPRLDPIVEKLLQPDPAQRYATAGLALADLEPLLSSAASTPPGPAARTGARAEVTAVERSVIVRGARTVRTGLAVVGVLALIAFGVRWLFGPQAVPKVTISGGGKEFVLSGEGGAQAAPARKPFTQNTYGEVFSAAEEKDLGRGRISLLLDFAPGEEELNVHTGEWRLGSGKLSAVQAGNETGGGRLVPRAYVAHRYFLSDDFDAEVEVTLRDVRDRYEVPDDVQRFGELAFRIKDLQVSAFAIPGVGMRLGWRYYTADGMEVSGNSARDLELMVEDEMPTPPDGAPFKLRLKLERLKDAVAVTAYANGRAFARKVLPGLQGQVGKVALGCRNYECGFDGLKVTGLEAEQPGQKPLTAAE